VDHATGAATAFVANRKASRRNTVSKGKERILAYKESRLLSDKELIAVSGGDVYPPKKVEDPVGSSAPYTWGGTDEWHGKVNADPINN
jgi:hypothetical protein